MVNMEKNSKATNFFPLLHKYTSTIFKNGFQTYQIRN